MPYDTYPAVDENNNFPPEIRQAIASSPEIATVVAMEATAAARLSLGVTLYASLSGFRDIRVIPVVIVGSSVAAQISSDRWPYLFNKRLQSAYPKTGGAEQAIRTLSTAVTTPPSGSGSVVINAAISGSMTGSYMTATSRAQIMALKPALVIHSDMPANDYGTGVLPGTVKSNMLSQLADIIAKENILFPCQHVVVGGYYPTIATPAAPIDEYRAAMQEACAAFPGKVIWVDTYDDWTQLRVGSGMSDPFDILATDNLHPNTNGHRVLADIVARLFDLPDGVAAGTVVVAPTVTTTTLNSFTVNVAYRQALAAEGSTPLTWTITAGAIPAGIVFSTDGVLSGTPTTAGAYSFTATVTNSAGTNAKAYSGSVASVPVAPNVTTVSLGNMVTESPMSVTMEATGSTPITWDTTSGAFPLGISMTTSGIVSGTPVSTGTYAVTIRATNSAATSSKSYTGNVTEPVITPTTLTSDGFATAGTMAGRVTDLSSGGTAKTWSVGAGSWSTVADRLKPSTAAGSGAVLIETGVIDNMQVSATVAAWTSGNGFYLEMFRNGASNAFMFGIGTAGTLVLSQSSTGAIQAFADTPASLVGKRLMMRYYGGKLSAWVGTVKLYETVIATSGGGTAGFSKSAAVDVAWDNFLVETLV